MSQKNESVGEGSPEGLSEAVEDGENSALKQLMMHIMRTAISPSNTLTPEAQVQVDLRKDKSRYELLEQLLLEVCPNGVDPAIWGRWLNGGTHVFEPKPKKVGTGDERPAQTHMRTSKRVRTQENKVARMCADLDEEERQLVFLKAHQNAAVHYQVVDQLVRIIASTFAMGPGWTVMRALSAYMSDEELDKKTVLVTGKEKERAIVEFRANKQKDTDKAMEGLDFFSGHEGFERAVRMAILEVIDEFESKREEWTQTGRRRRSKESMKETAHPDAQQDAEKVLEGLKQRF